MVDEIRHIKSGLNLLLESANLSTEQFG